MNHLIKDCVHGMRADWCEHCREIRLGSPISLNPFRLKSNGVIGLILDTPINAEIVEIFLAEGGKIITSIARSDIESFDESELTKEDRAKLLKTAENTAKIWKPKGPLTQREVTDEGPTHCWNCKQTLSYDKGSFGCQVCQQYVCSCGSCFCDITGPGINYRGEFYPPGLGLPCAKIDRRQLIRIIKALLA